MSATGILIYVLFMMFLSGLTTGMKVVVEYRRSKQMYINLDNFDKTMNTVSNVFSGMLIFMALLYFMINYF